MKRCQVAVFGSLLKDIELFSDEIFIVENKKDITRQKLLAAEYGAKIPIDEIYFNYGGSAGNVSTGLSKLGIKAVPVGMIGNDQNGKEMLEYFKSRKIDINQISINKKEPTGFSFILGSKKYGDHVIYTYKGASKNVNFLPALLNKFKADYFYIGSQSQKSWEKDLAKLFSKARKDSTQIVWNPGQKQLIKSQVMLKFLPQTEILILNKDEAIQLVMHFFGASKQINNLRYLITKLKTLGPTMVVITDGKRGANILDIEGKFYHLPAHGKKKPIDTVGAGDSFASGFLAGWIYWQDAKKALRLGLKNSGSVVMKIGAQNGLLSKKDIK